MFGPTLAELAELDKLHMGNIPGNPAATPNKGVKHDRDKIRMELLPPELLAGTAAVLTFGAEKYGERNWELGMDWGRPYGALLRHMNAWWAGEALDQETGLSHLWHAACCLSFLIAYEQRQIGRDNRPGSDDA